MEKSELPGEYIMRPEAGRDLLPVRHPGGLWRVWRMPEGNVMLQALDERKEPWGTLYLMEEHEFSANFRPYDASEPGVARIRADSPGLLAMWYEQAKVEPPHREGAPAPVIRREPSAESPWLDAFFNEEDPREEGKNDAEARARALEEEMRGAFAGVLGRLREEDEPALEELDRLINHPGAFTWRQKYMFTEFGLALRKLHLHGRALACHLRALSLAPKDEHVLFNVARAEYEMGNAGAAKTYLAESLAVAPDFEAARNFLQFLNSGGTSIAASSVSGDRTR